MTDTAKRFARHLEYHGYRTSGPGEGGWWHADHPRRCHVHFALTPIGLRLHGTIYLGNSIPVRHKAWLEFVNRFNEESVIARGTLTRDPDGDWFMRAAALLPQTYGRQLYGALLDAWHTDLEFIRHAPSRDDSLPVVHVSDTIN